MTPQQFIAKWQGCQLAERAFYQQHFNDLCALAGHPTPAAQDTVGDTFCFEKGATKAGGGNGWNDYTPEMTDEEILRRLLALNLQRSAA